jgi:transcriptional regulator with XRE-family HTH domain
MNKVLGNNIRRIRLFKDVLTETVAEKMGLSVSAYTKIERGETHIDWKRLEVIARILDVNVAIITSLDTEQILPSNTGDAPSPETLNVQFQEVDGYYLVPKPLMTGVVTMLKSSEKLLERLLLKIEKLENK